MTQITQLKLVKIPFSKLLKLELSRFAMRMIEIVEKHNPEELHIKELFDALVAETPRINNLKDKYGAHPLTEELRELRKMRALYISTIKFRLKVVTRENEVGVNEDMKTVKDGINHFLHNLSLSRNEEMYNQKITQFYAAIENNEKLSNALTSLQFNSHLNKLKAVHAEMQSVINARLISIAKRQQETTAELTKVVLTAIKNMIKQIEIAPILHPALDYAPLYNQMNQLFTEYRDIIKRRALFNKRKAEKIDNEESESIKVSTTTQLEEPTETVLQVNAEEKASTNEFAPQPLEMKNTVAMSSEIMQLSIVYHNSG
ncbi:MAG: hypothetical protein GX921_07425 [Bacteroidales bacterium]|nr:hypothetical protein [Bacteroidales bacterium]